MEDITECPLRTERVPQHVSLETIPTFVVGFPTFVPPKESTIRFARPIPMNWLFKSIEVTYGNTTVYKFDYEKQCTTCESKLRSNGRCEWCDIRSVLAISTRGYDRYDRCVSNVPVESILTIRVEKEEEFALLYVPVESILQGNVEDISLEGVD